MSAARTPRSTAPSSEEIIACLEATIDAGSLTRGRAYAEKGKVLDLEWVEPGLAIEGSVEGSHGEVYDTSVTIELDTAGAPVGFDGFCTCRVRRGCKHMVCLVLTGVAQQRLLVDQIPSITSRPPATRSARWEELLQSALAPDEEEPPGAAAVGLGLKFDLISPTSRPGRQSPTQAHLQVRPVVRDGARGWHTRGITWKTLDTMRWSWQAGSDVDAQVLVLKELRSLAHLNESNGFYKVDEKILLDTVRSRRVFDLLDEAVEAGVALVSGRSGNEHVTLHRTVVDGELDVRRTPSGLALWPALVLGDEEIDAEQSRLLGPTPYGVCWWEEDPATGAATDLSLARLAPGIDRALLELLTTRRFEIPADEAERFLQGYAPDLAERLRLTSSDASVTFPDARPRHLLLSIDPLGTEHLHLTWDWIRPGARPARRGTFGYDAGTPIDRESEDALLAEVTTLLRQGTTVALLDPGAALPTLLPTALVSGAAVLEFLTDLLPGLDAIDGVEIENIGEAMSFRAARTAPVITLGGTATQDWFDLAVTVTVDGEDVAFKDLFVALAEGQQFMVLPSGTFFPLDAPELAQLAQLIDEGRALWAGAAGTVRVGRLQAAWWDEVASLGIMDAKAAAWHESLSGLLSNEEPVLAEVPAGIDATLRPYQVEGFRWLAHLFAHGLGGILADDMGLGKTLQALALMVHVNEGDPAAPPFLVIAPTSVVGNWASEVRRFAPSLRVATVAEGFARRGVDLAAVAGGADVVITSYGLFRREFDAYEAQSWSGLFLDEAQFVKNPNAQASRRARMLSTTFKVAITGTPMENNLLELWSLFSIAAPGLLGSAERFKKHFALPIEKRQDAERLTELRHRIRPFMLRRTKEVVATELPPKSEQVLEVELSAKHRKIYDTYLHRERSKVLGLLDDLETNRFEIFRSLTLLRQASLDVALVDAAHAAVPSTKLEILAEMVGDVVAEGHKVLVFSQFTRFLRSAAATIEALGIDIAYLDGTTKDRQGAIERFREGDASVFLISLKAGGFGLNLTEADYCILLDPWWNPATEAQAVDRTHRIGQTKNVMVYRLVAKDTIEEKVMAMKATKAALFDDVINSGELSQVRLSAADIKGLLD